MIDIETVAQIIGVFAAAMNILSYQCKSKKPLMLMQFFGASLFCASFFMLGAIMGAILCEAFSLVSLVIGIIRHDIKRKPKAE